MADHPIPFFTPMIRALLADTKTQTRRVLKPQPQEDGKYHEVKPAYRALRIDIGDRLWVREIYFQFEHWEPLEGQITRKGRRQKWHFVADAEEVVFVAPPAYRRARHITDPATPAWHQRLGRFMPRRYSRLTLIVTGRRVQRLQEITLGDICAEGLASNIYDFKPVWRGFDAWIALWETINGPGSWAANPWVAAYTFTVHQSNIDAMPAAAPLIEEARRARADQRMAAEA